MKKEEGEEEKEKKKKKEAEEKEMKEEEEKKKKKKKRKKKKKMTPSAGSISTYDTEHKYQIVRINFFLTIFLFHSGNRDSSVSIVTVSGRTVWGSSPAGGEILGTCPDRP